MSVMALGAIAGGLAYFLVGSIEVAVGIALGTVIAIYIQNDRRDGH